jgi:hypothetical protein
VVHAKLSTRNIILYCHHADVNTSVMLLSFPILIPQSSLQKIQIYRHVQAGTFIDNKEMHHYDMEATSPQ